MKKRLTFVVFLASALTYAAPLPKEQPMNSVRSVSVLQEMGLENEFGKLPELPEVYWHDENNPTVVQLRPTDHPFRSLILSTAKFIQNHRKLGYPNSVPGMNGRYDADKMKEIQFQWAERVFKLEEVYEEFRKADRLRKQEAHPRWQAHYDLMLGWLMLEVARCNDYGMALAKIRTEFDGKLALMGEQNGWKFSFVEPMLSNRSIRDLALSGKTQLETVESKYEKSPWALIARQVRSAPLGVRAVPAVLEK